VCERFMFIFYATKEYYIYIEKLTFIVTVVQFHLCTNVPYLWLSEYFIMFMFYLF